MNLLGDKKKSEVVYEHIELGILVAVKYEDNDMIKTYIRKYKNKKKQPKDKVTTYKFILDEEHDSLKIDFSNTFEFYIKNLTPFPLK